MFFDDFDDLQFNDLDPDDFLYSLYLNLGNLMFLDGGGAGPGGGREKAVNTELYYRWSEQEMPDSDLLSYKPATPVYQGINSINGGHWFIIQELQEGQVRNNRCGWLEGSREISTHKRIREMSQQIALLLDAWKSRYRSLNMEWNSELAQTRQTPGLEWFFTQRSTQERELTVQERASQSVERGMAVFRSEEEFDSFYQEIKSAVNLVPNLLMKIISDAIPVQLPYTALSLISQYVLAQDCSDNCADRSTMKADSRDVPGQLVESRYLGRFFLSLLDIHSALTELMFRRAGETAAPNFADKFLYLRNIVQRNNLFLQSYYELTEENSDHHLKETKVMLKFSYLIISHRNYLSFFRITIYKSFPVK